MNIIYVKKEKIIKIINILIYLNEKILNEKNINNLEFSFSFESAKIFKNVIKK